MCQFHSENKFISHVKKVYKNRCCITKIIDPYYFGYVSTIGVIDEFRRFGIGRIILNKALDLFSLETKCIAAYLHVIEYNKSAIKFYISNNFQEAGILNDFYTINNAMFNSKVFYKILRNFIQFKDNENTKTHEMNSSKYNI